MSSPPEPNSPAMRQRMTREEFYRWAEAQPKGCYERIGYERIDGEVVAMTPERVGHVQIKSQVWQALDKAIRAAGLGCRAYADGLAVQVGEDTDYEPDVTVHCGPPLDLDSVVAANPVVVAEVLSRSTQSKDAVEKLAGYIRAPAVQHYLLVQSRRCNRAAAA
jgi:Uma2 family endonuclease